jgi:quercetin dioxygenase-like cupin family protein
MSIKYSEGNKGIIMRNDFMKCKALLSICIFGFIISFGNAWASDYDKAVRIEVLVKSTTTSDGQKLQYLKTENAEVTAMKVYIAPGGETGWHLHTLPVYAYVMTGKLSVEMEAGKHYEFGEGQVILEVMNTLHNGINKGSTPVKLIVFYTGAVGMPLVRKLDPPVK